MTPKPLHELPIDESIRKVEQIIKDAQLQLNFLQEQRNQYEAKADTIERIAKQAGYPDVQTLYNDIGELFGLAPKIEQTNGITAPSKTERSSTDSSKPKKEKTNRSNTKERSPRTNISPELVLKVKELLDSGMAIQDIAIQEDISRPTVYAIKQGKKDHLLKKTQPKEQKTTPKKPEATTQGEKDSPQGKTPADKIIKQLKIKP